MSKEMLQPAARAAHSGGNARHSSVMQIYIHMGIIASKNPLPYLGKSVQVALMNLVQVSSI